MIWFIFFRNHLIATMEYSSVWIFSCVKLKCKYRHQRTVSAHLTIYDQDFPLFLSAFLLLSILSPSQFTEACTMHFFFISFYKIAWPRFLDAAVLVFAMPHIWRMVGITIMWIAILTQHANMRKQNALVRNPIEKEPKKNSDIETKT